MNYYTKDSSHLNNYLRQKQYLERKKETKEKFDETLKDFSEEDFI